MLNETLSSSEVWNDKVRGRTDGSPAFRKLQAPGTYVDFYEAMDDPELKTVAEGIKRMMSDLGAKGADGLAELLGYKVSEHNNMEGGGLANILEPFICIFTKGLEAIERQFLLYHEIGHSALFTKQDLGLRDARGISDDNMEIYCDAFACLMADLEEPPGPYADQG